MEIHVGPVGSCLLIRGGVSSSSIGQYFVQNQVTTGLLKKERVPGTQGLILRPKMPICLTLKWVGERTAMWPSTPGVRGGNGSKETRGREKKNEK